MKSKFNDKAQQPKKEKNTKDIPAQKQERQYVPEDLSHGELLERIDMYGKVGEEPQEHYFANEKDKQDYLEKLKTINENETKALLNYTLGNQVGLVQDSPDVVKEIFQRRKQELINEKRKISKERYRDSNSPIIDFEKASRKDHDMDR
ncbi:MAG: hypothetical protein RIC35_02560 [Marinoscillum sp.]